MAIEMDRYSLLRKADRAEVCRLSSRPRNRGLISSGRSPRELAAMRIGSFLLTSRSPTVALVNSQVGERLVSRKDPIHIAASSRGDLPDEIRPRLRGRLDKRHTSARSAFRNNEYLSISIAILF